MMKINKEVKTITKGEVKLALQIANRTTGTMAGAEPEHLVSKYTAEQQSASKSTGKNTVSQRGK